MESLEIFLKAVAYATEKHRAQRRKDAAATPYINHPVQVADLMWRMGVRDVPALCAAILHDTIEDTDATEKEIMELFGQEICNLVLEVTDDKNLSTAELKRWQVQHAPNLTLRAKWIRVADKICNVRDIGISPPVRWDTTTIKGYFNWTENVVKGCRGCHAEMEKQYNEVLEISRKKLNL